MGNTLFLTFTHIYKHDRGLKYSLSEVKNNALYNLVSPNNSWCNCVLVAASKKGKGGGPCVILLSPHAIWCPKSLKACRNAFSPEMTV